MTEIIYFIRHGQTNWNAERRMQGQWESELTDLGRAQAKANAEAAAALGVDAIYASPLRRTCDSAQMLADETGLSVTFDDRLKEWHAGDWSGHLYDDVIAQWPEEWAAWRADMWRYRPPSAENFEDLTERGCAFLEDHVLGHQASRIAIVSHGFIGRVMIAHLLKLSTADALEIHQPNDVFFAVAKSTQGWMMTRHGADQSGDVPYAKALA